MAPTGAWSTTTAILPAGSRTTRARWSPRTIRTSCFFSAQPSVVRSTGVQRAAPLPVGEEEAPTLRPPEPIPRAPVRWRRPAGTTTTCGLIPRTPTAWPWPMTPAFPSPPRGAAVGCARIFPSRRCTTSPPTIAFPTMCMATSRMARHIADRATAAPVVRSRAANGTVWKEARAVGRRPIRWIRTSSGPPRPAPVRAAASLCATTSAGGRGRTSRCIR